MLIYRFNKEMAQIELYHNTDDDEPYEVIELDTAVWLYKNIVRCKECMFADVDAEAEMARCSLVSFPIWHRCDYFCYDGERKESE